MKLLFAASIVLAVPTAAEEIEIRTADSVLAVVTHKGGFASGVAHDHLVAASGYRAALAFDPDAPLEVTFEVQLASEQLAVDRWDLQQAWYPRLEKLGILGQAFSEVAEKDRAKIRQAMLAKGQLDATRFPDITARITKVRERSATHGAVTFPYAANLELTIRGRSVAQPVAARYQVTDGSVAIEAVGVFRFTDFGIEPYSAFLGAVKNEDAFHVYVNLNGAVP